MESRDDTAIEDRGGVGGRGIKERSCALKRDDCGESVRSGENECFYLFDCLLLDKVSEPVYRIAQPTDDCYA